MSTKTYAVYAEFKDSEQICNQLTRRDIQGVDEAMKLAELYKEHGFNAIVVSEVRERIYDSREDSTNC